MNTHTGMASIQKWSELPGELLDKIAKSLHLYPDYIRFRAVCVSWESSLPKTPNHLPRQFPLLMLPYDQENDKPCVFFSLNENKSYSLNFPLEFHNKFFRGACHGWLVIVDKTPSISLFNPFTNTHIELPPLSLNSKGFECLYKIVLSSSPNSSDFMAIAIIGDRKRFQFFGWRDRMKLAFCRYGDNRWSSLKEMPRSTGNESSYIDVIFYKKQQIVAAKSNGLFVIMDIIGGHGNSIPEIKVMQTLQPPDSVCLDHNLYLVESNDELLIVNRSVEVLSFDNCRDYDYKTTGFSVYKLDLIKNSSGSYSCKWSEMKSLGDQMVFLGLDPSSSFSTSEFPGCKGNCIYFTDDLWDSQLEGGSSRGSDVGLFDMSEQKIKPLHCDPRELNCLPPIWITPTPL
ncbi:F-box protein SKIP23-like [Telopea speciosissima]|uniref:F-box protein SKIP23-like n=1 Tax=Telopea speciosissima TaxID=54955 RepID=UPI001CC3BECD|nr:F-box protein SKIP23-like [Telopea speciosissima]